MLLLVFSLLYIGDLLYTAYMLGDPNYLDLAHFTFIPLVGEGGYFLLRLVLFLFFLAVVMLNGRDRRTVIVAEFLTGYYVAITLWNTAFYILYIR